MQTPDNLGNTAPDPSEADQSAAGRRRASTVAQVPEPDPLPERSDVANARLRSVRQLRPISNETVGEPAPAPAKKVAAKKATASKGDA